jgi:bisphosphoglycerate-dependent phosphoglycerate mutase
VAMLLILIVIFLLIFNMQHKDFTEAIKQRINSYLVYRIQLDTRIVYVFDPRKPQIRQTLSMEAFLESYLDHDAQSLFNWFEDLIKGTSETPWIYQAQLNKVSGKKNRMTIFEVTHIDYGQKKIHLQRYSLNFLKPVSKNRDMRSHIINIKQAIKIIEKMPRREGAFYYLQLQYSQSELDDQFKTFYLTQIKERILPYLNNQLLMLDTSNHIYLIAVKGNDNQSYIQIAQTISRIVSQYIEINGLETVIKTNLAVVEHKFFPNNFNILLRKGRELAQLLFSKKIPIAIYDPEQPIVQTLAANQEKFYQEVFVHYSFKVASRLLVELPEVKPFAYQIQITHQQQSTMSTFDMLVEANQLDNPKEFYRRYLMQVHAMSNEDPILLPVSLFMKLNQLEQEIKILSNSRKIIFLVEEQELFQKVSVLNMLQTNFAKWKTNQFQFALVLDDYTVSMDRTIYQFFDFFVLDNRRMKFIETNERAFIQFKMTIQNFKDFQIPFMTIDLTSESVIDSLPLNHVKIIGADFISPFNEQIVPVNKRNLNRIKAIILKQEKIYGKTN